jgi:hypothetical protein
MRTFGSLIAMVFMASAIAACGGAKTTQTPSSGDGRGPTAAPEATSADGSGSTAGTGGGGTVVGTGNGTLNLTITGPVQKSADYPFIPAGSILSNDQGGSLSFADDAAGEVVSVLVAADKSVVVSFGSQDFAVPGATCTTTNWTFGVSGASGSFECKDGLAIKADGSQVTGVTMKGTVNVHA